MAQAGEYGSGTPGAVSFSNTVGGNLANGQSSTTGTVATGAGLTPYEGLVATRCGCLDGGYSAGQSVSINRSAHIATDNITRLRVIYPNWGISNNSEFNFDADVQLLCYIEYPTNTYTPITFSGKQIGTTPRGGNFISDYVNVTIPRGATFYMRPGWQFTTTSANGIPSNGSMLPNWGAGTATGSYWEGIKLSTNPADLVLAGKRGTGGNSGNSDGFSTNFSNRMLPLAILGITTRPSFALVGDSIAVGVGDAADSQLACGFIARALGNKFGYVNLGVSGEAVNGLTANAQYAQRAYLAQFCSHVISNYGTNDIGTGSGRTAAQVITDISAFRLKWFPTQVFYQTTLLVRTTSSDAFVTEANQTVVATDAVRAAFNDQLRLGALTSRFDGILDVDQICQNSYNGRKWKAFGTTTNRMTADGTHPSPYGAQYIAAQTNLGLTG